MGLVVCGDLEEISGGNLYDQKLVDYLRDNGHDVDVLSLPHGGYRRRLSQNFVPGRARRFSNPAYDLILQDELAHPSLYRLNHKIRERTDVPIVSIVHHLRCSEDWPEEERKRYREVEHQYLESIDAFVFNSETTRESVEALVQKKTLCVVAKPGGDRFETRLGRAEVQARAESGEPLRFLFVGNLIPRKGLHVLLDALAELREHPWHLDVIGSLTADAAYVERIRRQSAELGLESRMTFHGTLDGEALAERYRQSHAFTVPSNYEGFGIVFLEAMAFGLPVVACAAGATDEIVRHESTGLLVQPDDVFGLRIHLERLLEDNELLSRLSITAFETFSIHASWEQSMAKIEAFLESLPVRVA